MAKQKLKTNSGMKKRVRRTASGKLKRRRAFKSHIATSKTTKRKRQLRKSTLIHPSDQATANSLLKKSK